MKTTFLDFEKGIEEFEEKIDQLRFAQDNSALDISAEIAKLQAKSQALTKVSMQSYHRGKFHK